MAKEKKLNSMRLLEKHDIDYVIHRYDASFHSAVKVAAILHIELSRVFKTLVVLPVRGKPVLAVIPANSELDLKRLARAASEKKLAMASHKEAESLTGLKVGGISSLALVQKRWRVFLDASAVAHDRILMSAGQRGCNLELGVSDFIKASGAFTAEIAVVSQQSLQQVDLG